MKLCIDCKHLKRELWCQRPGDINPVNGEPVVRFALIERKPRNVFQRHEPCGPDARYFEQQTASLKPWWRFWK